MWVVSGSGCRWLGAGGALAVAVGGYAAGALPVIGGGPLWAPRASATETAGAVLAALGLTVLVAAWWRYGVLLARGAAGGALGTLAAWGAPLLLAPPLHSADVYSYIAQGAMVLEGHDVYGAGPSVLGPGELGADAAASVGGNWTDTPAPYGPVFLLLAEAVVKLTGGAVVPAVLLLRLVAVAAVALLVWAVRGFGKGDGALWLAVLNPLLLVHVVGGTHNDGLMAGLMLGGVLLAVRGRWVLGSVLVGCAVMVKSPAAVALLFVAVIVARRDGLLKGLVLPPAVAGAVAAGASLLAGTGFGWLRTQSVAGAIHTPLSLTSDLGLALGTLVADDPEPVKAVVQKLGLLAAAVLILVLAWRAWRGRLDPVLGLGHSLVVLVALSPMVQPWYLLWGTAAVAAVAWHSRAGQLLAVVSAALVYETQPAGHTPWYGFAAAGLVLALGVVWLRRDRWPAAADGLSDRPAGTALRA
ncbi:polyprenol phosphomannose-dependent alpha 1,6 mannosyltransferase MptB [Streptomyces roseofulvus]|uniref:Polyprenol phosphomannose-dependent alpha 1,6 mannosyltransferase MptB n=2 Tax=Streptomyces TaxID=1883 RepID=A0ABU4KFM1_9ACTN|nr:polyprenol phosphomannose-dependent alpha 1,6 mannosyltransferase MptB [Streptomyces roseolus]MDX2296132.1 polyprenol phosphomannose-dependent alpha 1,6 mannosyltransferase MptB [Streptomyces roseolus]